MSSRLWGGLLCLLAGATLLAASAQADELPQPVFPGKAWQEATPESQGVDPRRLNAALQYLERHSGSNGVRRVVVVRNGRIIWKGPEADVAQPVWSVSKAFLSTAQGLLIDDGRCTLDTLAKDYAPEYLARYYPEVRLRHFATMTSGYDGVGGAYDFDDQHRGDRNALVPPEPPFFPPGAKFQYWDEATQVYGYVLTNIAGQSLEDYLRKRVLEPIGVTTFQWRRDETGRVLNWTGGVVISAADLARFGLLFLNRGRWNGRQVVPADWVDQATQVQVPPTVPDALPKSWRQGSGVYGYHWWVNGRRPDGQRYWPHAPLNTYCRSGYNNNRLWVIPAWNMVIVRLGLDQREHKVTREEWDEFLRLLGESVLDPVVDGRWQVWHTVTVSFRGPQARQTDREPNPFLDYRLQVRFTGPSGQTYDVPGFFDGDGFGGGQGNVWRVRFTPDEPGRWVFRASFRQGRGVAVSLGPDAGQPTAFDGASGSFVVRPSSSSAPGFLKWGRLEYVGGHYLKFRNGPYWLKGGTDSPENFLAYAEFDNTRPSHRYASHVDDWRPGDPVWKDGRGRGIIGALNYLADKHVNSVYFLVMNVGGDGQDVWPWVGPVDPKGSPHNDNLHYDVGKLAQWETVFDHAQRRGIFLHFVFNEAEKPNKRELDDGELGTERKLYYREMVARFGHHLALEWNLCEEYNLGFDFGPERVRAFADYVKAVDPYDHPIAVHSAGNPLKALAFTFGDPRFSLTSIQLGQRRIDTLTEQFRRATAEAGRPVPVSLDEFTVDRGQRFAHIPVNDPDGHRKEKIWPTYLSGGMLEFILADQLKTDSFKKPELARLWDYLWYARKFVEQLPFWRMEPADELVTGEGTIRVGTHGGRGFNLDAQVFALRGQVYAVYLPKAEPTGTLDLSGVRGRFRVRWYNPRTGQWQGEPRTVEAGRPVALGPPPADPAEDWAVLVERVEDGRQDGAGPRPDTAGR